MAVKAKIKILQEAISNMLPPSSEQAASLSDMLLSIYRGRWWHMCPGSAMIQLITVRHCIQHCGLSQVILLFINKTLFIFPIIYTCSTTRRFSNMRDVTLFMCCVQ